MATEAAKIALIEDAPSIKLKFSKVPKIGAAQIEKKIQSRTKSVVIPQFLTKTRTERVSNFFIAKFLFVDIENCFPPTAVGGKQF
jgi:hypothetical protein